MPPLAARAPGPAPGVARAIEELPFCRTTVAWFRRARLFSPSWNEVLVGAPRPALPGPIGSDRSSVLARLTTCGGETPSTPFGVIPTGVLVTTPLPPPTSFLTSVG